MAGDRKKIRVLVVDDEPFARERVRRLLERDEDTVVIGECKDGFEAVAAIEEQSPDLLFLDVQMPGKDGFGVLTDIAADKTPVVIFLTAYDQYAVRAFDAAAIDYLLKPFDEDRFAKALARAKMQLTNPAKIETSDEPLTASTDAMSGALGSAYLERIIIRTGGRVLFRNTSEIDWIEAYGNYVRLHFGKSVYLLRETIGHLEARLDPAKFTRIHRSTLVQINRIREMQPQLAGQYRAMLRDGTKLTLSRRYRRNLKHLLGDEQ